MLAEDIELEQLSSTEDSNNKKKRRKKKIDQKNRIKEDRIKKDRKKAERVRVNVDRRVNQLLRSDSFSYDEHDESFSVPFINRKHVCDDNNTASFVPHPDRVNVVLGHDLDEQCEDNPRDVFDNRPSAIPWDDTGRFNNPVEMKNLINRNCVNDPLSSRIGGVVISILSCGAYYAYKKKSVRDGYFRIVDKAIGTKIKLPGYHTLFSTKSSWGRTLPLDNEEDDKIIIGNKTILRVRANHLGVAYLVGDKYLTDEDGEEELLGRDGDIVLFSQGSYVLDESQYRAIYSGAIDETEQIIVIGDVTILNIAQEYVGGARHRGTNEYRIFQTGAPLVFDNKEWTNFDVVERTIGDFRIGPIQFITVSAQEIACVGKKDGNHLLLIKENTYFFHTREFETFEKTMNTDNFNVGAFYVRTIGEDEVGVVRSLKTGKYHRLIHGKYYLYTSDWSEPQVMKLNQPVVVCGPWAFVRVQNDYFTGARNAITGEFDEFESTGETLVLHVKEYPHIERVKKVDIKEKRFGPYKIVTVPNGKYGIFEEDGDIRVAEPDTYKLSPGCRMLEMLPSCPQEITLDCSFLTKDGIEISVGATILFALRDPEKVARKINASETKFVVVLQEIKQYCLDEMLSLLRKFKKEQLLEEVEMDVPPDQLISSTCLDSLNRYSNETALGVSFNSLTLTGGFRIRDKVVLRNVTKLAQAKLATEANQAQAVANEYEAKAQSVMAIQNAEMEKQVKLKIQQAELESQEMALRTEKMQADQRLAIMIAEEEAQKAIKELKVQTEQLERKAKADDKAYEITHLADAEYYKAMKENEAAENRPTSIIQAEQAKILVEAASKFGNAAWIHPEPLVELLQRIESLGGDSNGNPLLAASLLGGFGGKSKKR
eukprot:TRINITY_DN1857_c0_g1_i1.p1 TRINITY_DN1857_c0_g1~~TRINITY_DN1857_c0_g1_i1.p1  ORF type:complete len:882 (-),score=247.59 TRINITY_DN1857_c0_g1_i1:42-2687(-)